MRTTLNLVQCRSTWFLMILLALVSTSYGQDQKVFTPGSIWKDSDGIPINAHGLGALYHNGLYYIFGQHMIEGRAGNAAHVGVSCYSSENLYNWKNEGIALSVIKDTSNWLQPGCAIERPKVIYNKTTGKFVMWFHHELKGRGYDAAMTGVAVADHVTGPYTYLRSLRPNAQHWPVNNIEEEIGNSDSKAEAIRKGIYLKRDFGGGQMARDMTLYVDDDGTAYHIHASEENFTLHISELTGDYLDFTGRYWRVLPGDHNEAPAIFKSKDKYYMISSGCTGWAPNPARSAVADHISGPWIPLGNPCRGTEEQCNITFDSQSTYILPVEGKKDQFILMSDRWRPKNAIDGRYIWLPITFEDEKPVIRWHDAWNLPD